MQIKPIIILGGTFDPIHLGHMHFAEKIVEVFDPEKLLLIPCNQSPTRSQPIASAEQRLAMLKLALNYGGTIQIDAREIKRGGVSYAIDTLHEIRSEIGNDKPLCLTIGIDAFNNFTAWHNWQDIPTLAHLIIVNRPDTKIAANNLELQKLLAAKKIKDQKLLSQKAAGYIAFIDIKPLPISATNIRTLIKNNDLQHAKTQLAPTVWNYICQNSLYSK